MKLLKKKNEVVKEVKAKSAPKTSGSEKKATKPSGKNLNSWVIQPVLASLILMVGAYFSLEFIFLQPAEENHKEQTKSLVVSTYAKALETHVNARVELLSAIAKSESVAEAIGDSAQSVKAIRGLLSAVHGDIEQIYILKGNQIASARSLFPDMSFASVDLLRRIMAGEKVKQEAFYQEKNWVYQLAQPILPSNATDKNTPPVGVVLAVFNTDGLAQQLNSGGSIPDGELALLNSSEANAKVIVKRGSGDASNATVLPLKSSSWALRYTPSDIAFSGFNRVPLWGVFAGATLVLLLAIILLSRAAMQSLKSDLIKATQTLRFIISEEGRKAKDIRFTEVQSLLAAADASMKEIKAAMKKAATKAASVKTETDQHKATEEPLFEDDLLDLDELSTADDTHDPLERDINQEEGEAMVQEVEQLDLDVPQSIFRAYDIRGVVDETLNEGIVELIGKALASEALAQGQTTLCVGYDGRLSSVDYCEAITRGIVSTGANAIIVGQVPTPVLYFAAHHLETGTGVMITGSHNPSNYNGFKMMIGGSTLSGDDIQKLYNRIILQDFASGQGARSQQPVDRDYLDTILNDIAVAAPLKVVVDAGNGVAGELAPALIEELGCEVIPLHCEIDGTFPNHHPDPGKPENLQDLIAAVAEHEADIGLAFDGDGDRVGVVTNTGKIIWPDRLLMLFAKDVVSRNPGADIIFDVKCSRRLNGLITGYGGRPIMWKTGHSLIKAKMKETGALLAGEMSGHIFFKERWYGFDDGLYSAARLLEILGIDDRSSEDVFASFPEDVSTPEINIAVTDENKFSIIERLCETKDQFQDANVSTIDGLRVDFENGWGLCRASNTTPMLVLRFEADDEAALQQIKEKFRQQLLAVEPGLQVDF